MSSPNTLPEYQGLAASGSLAPGYYWRPQLPYIVSELLQLEDITQHRDFFTRNRQQNGKKSLLSEDQHTLTSSNILSSRKAGVPLTLIIGYLRAVTTGLLQA